MQFGLDPGMLMSSKLPHIAISLAVLAGPGLTAWAVDSAWRMGGFGGAYLSQLVQRWAAALQPSALSTVAEAAGGPAGGSLASAFPGAGAQQAATSAAGGAAAQWQVPGEPSLGAGAGVRAPPFMELSYGFLPLVWAATLAHYYDSLLEEAGRVLPVSALLCTCKAAGGPALLPHLTSCFYSWAQVMAATFGVDAPWLPTLTMHPEVSHAMQVGLPRPGQAVPHPPASAAGRWPSRRLPTCTPRCRRPPSCCWAAPCPWA